MLLDLLFKYVLLATPYSIYACLGWKQPSCFSYYMSVVKNCRNVSSVLTSVFYLIPICIFLCRLSLAGCVLFVAACCSISCQY
jgi:hypothetical protein